jgi:AcrR family transcriptional regulator
VTTEVLRPRERLLATARRLFYSEGIHSVGVDRLVGEAGVTLATFYRHFPTKEALVEAYLRATDEDLRTMVNEALAGDDPHQALEALLDLIGHVANTPEFRGDWFINAAAEYPDARNPVRTAVREHREWFETTVRDLTAKTGHPDPVEAGRILVLLHDGALTAAQLDDPTTVQVTLKSAALALLRGHT